MKKRLLSAAIGIILAVAVLLLNVTKFPWLLNISIAVIACMSLYEILVATGFIDNAAIVVTSFAATAIIQFLPVFPKELWTRMLAILAVCYFIALFIILLFSHNTLKVERIGLAYLITTLIALPFFSINYMYWVNPCDTGEFRYIGQSLVIYCLLVSWLTDAGAYFTGVAFGKHKLAPKISPKKTVEGAVGGFVTCIMLVSAIAYLLTVRIHIYPIAVHWRNLLIITAVSSMLSMVGDLSFSIIKRGFDVKDFGNVLPGHGGVLDRFDSVIFVSPVVCVMNMYLPVIIKI